MAKLVLTISADNKATQSVKLLNAEVQALSKTLSSITVNKDLTTQINALTKHYKTLEKAAVNVNEVTAKRQLIEQKLATEVKKGATETYRGIAAKARAEKAELSLATAQNKATKATQAETLELQRSTEAANKHEFSIGSLINKYIIFRSATSLLMKPLQWIRSAFTSLNETLVKTEDTIIAFQRVVGKDISGEAISSELYRLAKDYGQTFENVQSIALDFARTGLSWSDTIKATEAALLGLNTAELDATSAATGLIAVMQQYGLEASQLESIIDKLNITQDNAAVTTDKLLTALSRTGSSAKNANLSLEETVALITALSAATGRSGENLGTALNSLIQYSSKSTALDTFSKLSDEAKEAVDNYRKGMKKANGETYSILDVWRQVSKEMQNLKAEQADMLDAYFATEDGTALKDALDGELKDFYGEMNGVYDTANTFRKNYFIALLGNMDEVEAALGRMDESAGYSQAQQNDYMKSYTAQLNEVKAQWEYLASREQGLLELKKFGLDIAEVFLKLIQSTGGLRTTIMAAATALTFLVGDKIITGIVKIGKSFKSITSPLNNFTKAVEASRAAKEASLAATEAQNTADAIRNGQLIEGITLEQADKTAKEMQTIATQKATVATQAWGVAIKTALGIIGLVITGVSMLVGIIDSIDQNKAQEQAEWISKVGDEASTAVEKLSDLQNSIDATKQAYADYAKKVEEARKVLDDENSSTEEIASAESTLNEIQKALIESNFDYADSIDLINGKLEEQLDLLEKLGEEQARKKVQDYLENNSGAIYDANKFLTDKHSELKFEEAVGEWEGLFKDAPLEKWLKSLGYDASEQAGLGEGLGSFFTNKKVFKTTLFHDGMTLDEQLELLKNLRAEAAKIEDKELREYIDAQLNKAQIAITSSEAYKQANNLINGNANSSNWIERLTQAQREQLAKGELTIDQVKKILGLEEEISKELGEQTNDISKVTGIYDDLISKLEELRDLNKDAYDWEEKKKAVLEAEDALLERQNDLIKAQQALLAAQNEATVRRFNQDTNQWEWQVDEKKIAEAEEAVKRQEENVDKAEDDIEKARLNLEQAAYNKIIDQLKNQTATNESILEIIEDVVPFLGEDFANAVKSVLRELANVDLDKPIKDQTDESAKSTPDEQQTQTKSELDKVKESIRVLEGASGKGIAANKKGDNGEVTWNGKTYKVENGGALSDNDIISQATLGENGLGWTKDKNDRTIFAYNGEIYGYLDGKIVKLQKQDGWSSFWNGSGKHYDSLKNDAGVFDSGGIANGLGYMVKATSEPEVVNDPELTRKILSPVSNREWETYAKQMGIMFEQAHNFARMPQFERVNTTNDNRVDNSGQVHFGGGITLAAEAQRQPLSELLAQYKTVSNL